MKTFTFLCSLFLISFIISSSLYSQTAEELIQEGDKYYTEFNDQKALETYQKADKLNPGNWEILWRISRAIVDVANKMPEETDEQKDAKFDQYKKSFVYADSAVKLAPDQSVTYVRRAIVNGRIALFEGVFSAIGTVNDVRDDCERAIELNNGGNYVQALAHYVLARAHAKVCEKAYLLRLPLGLGWGDMDVAIREYQTAIKLKPNMRMFYLGLAKAYIEEDEYKLAKENLLLVEKAPVVIEDDDEYLKEAKQLLAEVNKELE
jgi:tetratricopeptide (TPR) repeat protein